MAREAPRRLKILVLSGENQDHWLSMKTIVRNLTELYKQASDSYDLRFQSVSPGRGLKDLKSFDLARQTVRDWRPDKIVFIDDYPHPGTFIKIIACSDYKPEFFIHLFGSFTYFSDCWSMANDALIDQKIHWICASTRSAKLLGKCLKGADPISVLPLPLDSDLFFWCPKTRLETRAEMGLNAETRLLIYTGRIHLQKGVDRLVEHLQSIALPKELSLRITLAGEFDDSGVPLFGIPGELGFQYLLLQEAMKGYAQDPLQNSKSVIRCNPLVGKQNQTQIRKLLCAADAFCSLSLFNDEDYGMAPAEAGMCGLPIFLTDWGGYSDFKLTEDCYLFPTELTSHGINYSSQHFVESIKDFLTTSPSEDELVQRRENQSKAFQKQLSIPALVSSLQDILSQDLSLSEGFNEIHKNFAELAKRKARRPCIPFVEAAYQHLYGKYSSSESFLENQNG